MIKIDLSRFSPPQDEPVETGEWAPIDLWTWLQSVQGEPEYLFHELVPADSKIIFTGKPKRAYKSWMAYTMALSAASGKTLGPFVPCNPEGVNVLILAQEGGKAQNRNRFMWLAKGLDIDVQALNGRLRFSFKEPIRLKDPDWVYKIKKFVAAHNIKLVVIDPLIMFMAGLNENQADQWAIVMQALNDIGSNGATIVFVHHLTKTQKDWDRDIDEEIRGTSALAGFYDQHWAFRKKRESQNFNHLTIRSKDDEEKFFEVRWSIDKPQGTAVFKMTTVTEEVQEAEQQELIATVVEEMIPGQEYSKKSIGAIAHVDATQVEQLIAEMLKAQVLEKKGRGVYALRHIDKPAEIA